MTARIPLIINAGTSQIQELPSGDDLNLTGSNISAVTNVTASGYMTVNSSNSATAIINGGSNTVGNIGSTSTYFNTVFAQATTALYADLAEKYIADADYPVGTVIRLGGMYEVSQSRETHATNVIGTVSENPAYVMNSGLEAQYTVTVALVGRVPCRVIGTISKGDCLVASEIHGVATVLDPELWAPGCIIGKAMENYNSDKEGIIEIVVGRA